MVLWKPPTFPPGDSRVPSRRHLCCIRFFCHIPGRSGRGFRRLRFCGFYGISRLLRNRLCRFRLRHQPCLRERQGQGNRMRPITGGKQLAVGQICSKGYGGFPVDCRIRSRFTVGTHRLQGIVNVRPLAVFVLIVNRHTIRHCHIAAVTHLELLLLLCPQFLHLADHGWRCQLPVFVGRSQVHAAASAGGHCAQGIASKANTRP